MASEMASEAIRSHFLERIVGEGIALLTASALSYFVIGAQRLDEFLGFLTFASMVVGQFLRDEIPLHTHGMLPDKLAQRRQDLARAAIFLADIGAAGSHHALGSHGHELNGPIYVR